MDAERVWWKKEITRAFRPERSTACLLRHAVALFVGPINVDAPETTARLDKWLWSVRIFKTRSLATDACRAGSVEIGGLTVKPARDVRVGEIISVKQGIITRTLQVAGLPRARVGAKLVPQCCVDLTPESEFAKARENRLQQVLAREKGSGRPTKRERRVIDRLFGN